MLNYPAKLAPDGSGWLVTFRDVPEALTSGATREEAIAMAADALVTALDFYFEDQRAVALPSKARANEVLIPLTSSTAAKVLLLNEMVSQKIRPADLAKRMGTTRQEMNRITSLRHPTKIDTIDTALASIGKHLELRVA